jgi:hypothetical protein
MPPTADRILLLGILALQTDFITRDALIAAMLAWSVAKHRPLEDILVDQGALEPAYRDLLRSMIDLGFTPSVGTQVGSRLRSRGRSHASRPARPPHEPLTDAWLASRAPTPGEKALRTGTSGEQVPATRLGVDCGMLAPLAFADIGCDHRDATPGGRRSSCRSGYPGDGTARWSASPPADLSR